VAPLPREFAEPLQRLGDDCLLTSRVSWHAETGSTNADAAALAEAGAPEGCVVLADLQTAGRGRLGRSWSSPAGTGIYASVLFRPEPRVARMLTIAAGVALAEAIEAVAGIAPVLKWPNDVYLGGGPQSGRKVAGILAEAGVSRGETWVVIGFGINVLPASFPHELALRATSLESELGKPVDRGELFAACLLQLAARYTDLRTGRREDVVGAWRRRAWPTFGSPVEWIDEGAAKAGVVSDIDEAGGLLVDTEAGIVRVVSGELRWL
jgi:BirA family transcriptional regulator, biotin operon repressor / biotin---[acetyl-CoA-carboxylase] ligase